MMIVYEGIHAVEYSDDDFGLFKPQVLFLGGLVNPVAEVFFGFVQLPKMTFRFRPSAVSPTHIVNFGCLRL